MNQEQRLDYLINFLENENQDIKKDIIRDETKTVDAKIYRFRGLCNIRQPKPVTKVFLEIQDQFLTEWNNESVLTSLADLKEIQSQLYLWQGDITTLEVDAIVNAANSDFIGCLYPNHNCIDNIIHTHGGVELRLECHEIIKKQGRKEPVGKAKITKGYNLPSDYVIHTVGPYIDEKGVSKLKKNLLASCYRSSLILADERKLNSVAFCCISTGEFNFPNEYAAAIAVETVKKYLSETGSSINVIFNVFKDHDLKIYQSLLEIRE